MVTTQADIKLKCAIDADTALLLDVDIKEESSECIDELHILRINSLGFFKLIKCLLSNAKQIILSLP